MIDDPGDRPYYIRKIEKGSWQKWFAWKPVKIRTKKVWLKFIYRRTVNMYSADMNEWQYFEYSTLFDIIKGEE
jgi:hypothetical protein